MLVVLDGSPAADAALRAATSLARELDAELYLLKVLGSGASAGGADAAGRRRRREARSYLKRLVSEYHGEREVGVEASVSEDDASKVLRTLRRVGADLLVLPAFDHEGGGPGGTDERIVTGAGISILVVREEAGEPGEGDGPIVVPVDGSSRAEWGARVAARLARSRERELVLLHVVPRPRLPEASGEPGLLDRHGERALAAGRRYVDDLRRRLGGEAPEFRSRVVEGESVCREIHRAAKKEGAGLIVLSAHGAGGVAPWPYGSVARHLLEHARVSVLVLQDAPAPRWADRWRPPRTRRFGGSAAADERVPSHRARGGGRETAYGS